MQTDEPILEEYQDVFQSLGLVKGVEHTIHMKPGAVPVVHPPHPVPVALSEPFKEELHRMERLNVIVKVHEPTDWISSLVIIRKNNKIRVCMDLSRYVENITP